MMTGLAAAQDDLPTAANRLANSEEAIELEVRSVSRELNLDDDQTEKLKTVVFENRVKILDAFLKRMAEGVDDNAVLMTDVYAMQVRERNSLREEVSSFLDDAQTQRVVETLGSYNLMWDGFILVLNRVGLSPEVQVKAEDRLLEFVTNFTPVRDEGYQNGDLSFVVKAMIRHKRSLDRDMKEILPERAYGIWIERTEFKFRNPEGKSED